MGSSGSMSLLQNRPCFLLRLFDWQLLLKHQWQRLQQYPPNLGSGWICFVQLGLAHKSPTRLCAPTGSASTGAASGMSTSSSLWPDDIPEAEDNQTASPLEIDINMHAQTQMQIHMQCQISINITLTTFYRLVTEVTLLF